MRKQKLHNNRLRSTTPIFLPFLGPAAAFSSAQYSHRCGRFLGQKHGFPTIFRSRFSYKNALNDPRFHPGCLLTALDQLCLTLSCRRSVVSFRCEEAAPPTSPPPPPPPPPRSSTPLPSIVVLISCSRAKDNVTTRKTPCCLHV